MKWIFGNKEQTQIEGLVGVNLRSGEKPGISMAYTQNPHSNKIDAYAFETAGSPEEIQNALTRFVSSNNLRGVSCSYVLSENEYTLTLMDAPKVEEKEMGQALKWMVQEVINFPIEEASIDRIELPLARARDNMKMVYAVVMRKNVLPSIENLITKSGLVLKYIDIPELALNNILKHYQDKTKGIIFIYLDPNCGHMMLARDGMIDITRSITSSLKPLQTPEKTVDAERVLENLVVEIQRLLDYFVNLFRQGSFERILLAPTILNHVIIQEGLTKRLGLDVRVAELDKILIVPKSKNNEERERSLLAMGATLRNNSDATS